MTAGDELLAQFPRQHMAPGEMEKIVLPKALLDRAAGRNLQVSVAAEEEVPHEGADLYCMPERLPFTGG